MLTDPRLPNPRLRERALELIATDQNLLPVAATDRFHLQKSLQRILRHCSERNENQRIDDSARHLLDRPAATVELAIGRVMTNELGESLQRGRSRRCDSSCDADQHLQGAGRQRHL